MKAWHFVGDKLRNGEPIPPDGEILRYNGPLEMCVSGLHASERIIDALKYARGNTLCRVECGGEIVKSIDKLVCRERAILWRVNGEKLLREFARKQALSVMHLWEAPQIVRQYLETGDELIRDAAWWATVAGAGIGPGTDPGRRAAWWATVGDSFAASTATSWAAASWAAAGILPLVRDMSAANTMLTDMANSLFLRGEGD